MKDPITTKEKLIRAGIKLFSKYGYTATSTRMIAAEAGVNLSAIAFHFTNKESLYQSCLNYLVEKIQEYYGPFREKINQEFADGTMTKEKAWEYLKQLIDAQIEVAFGSKYQMTREMVYREDSSPDSSHILGETVFHQEEEVMARLLQALAPLSMGRARVISRFINGSIIAFGEHKSLIAPYVKESEEEDPDWVRNEIRRSCVAIVRELMNSGPRKIS